MLSWIILCFSLWWKTTLRSWAVLQLQATTLTTVPLLRTIRVLLYTRAEWAWADTMPPSRLLLQQVATTQVASASTNLTSTTVALVPSHQAEAPAMLQCLQVSRAPVLLLQATHLHRLATRPPRQASAARVSAPHLPATPLPALSIRQHHRATHPPRLRMALPLHHRTLQPRPVTHRRRLHTRLPRQATVLLHQRIVVQLRHTTAQRHLRTVQLRLHTARRAHNLVQATTGARLPRPRRRLTALPAPNILPQALLATQHTRLRRPGSLPRHRARHHTRRLRLSGRLPARLTRLRKSHWSWL